MVKLEFEEEAASVRSKMTAEVQKKAVEQTLRIHPPIVNLEEKEHRLDAERVKILIGN